MRTPTCLCLLLICMLISCTPTQEKHEIDYTSYVNPFIGTDFTGNTYPGAQAPFGMVRNPRLGPHLRIFLPGQHDCRIQPHAPLRYRSWRSV